MSMYYAILALAGVVIISFLVKKECLSGKVLVFWNLVITVVYLVWRVTVIPTKTISAFILGILLIGAELIGIIQFFAAHFLLSNKYQIKKKTLDDFHGEVPSLDVFICTYNEPESLVETTVLAALNLEYPAEKIKVFVCDDGHRESMAKLSKRCGVGYLTRKGNEGAKAGNINNALRQTDGDLFVVLDADMICSKKFLKRTVGYFSESNTAFVQTPQVYYNKDMYQHNLNKNIPNEQDFFMREIQEARAAVNAVLHVGTNAIFRRNYVVEIGMYPTFTITEDMAVGMLLQQAGYESVFINEVLVLGLTASTYTDLVIQRDRWCRGNLQTTKRYRPMRSKQFNRMQKLAYFSGMIYWYTGFSKMIFTFLPIWFLLTMQPSMNAEFKELLFFFVPYFVGQIVSFYSSVTNTLSLKWAHYYEIAMAPHMCVSILKEHFASKNIFSVTPKEMRDDRSYFQTKVIVPHMILGGITILSWLIGFYYLQEGWIPFSAFMINFFWSLYNLIGIVICIRVAYHMAHIKHTEIAEIKNGQTASILIDSQQYSIILTDLLKTGMLFQSDSILPTGKAEMQFSYGEEMVVIQGVIKGSEHSMEFIYEKLNLSQQKAIVGIYVEHLQPSFDVEKYMHYI